MRSEHVLDFDHTKDVSLVSDNTLDQLSACGVHIVYLLGEGSALPGRQADRPCVRDAAHSNSSAGVWTTGQHAVDYSASILPSAPRDALAASPFAVAAYDVPSSLGGDRAVCALRGRCHARGMRLMLDFVPNHVAVDHPWATEQPGLLVTCDGGSAADCTAPQHLRVGGVCIANGAEKAASSGAWGDTLQVDYSSHAARAAMCAVVCSIAERGLADGLRCDMAHLVLSDRFAAAWGAVRRELPTQPTQCAGATSSGAGRPQQAEFWEAAVASARAIDPHFVFLAESYGGDSAWALQQLGFNFTYDDSFYHKSRGASALALQRKWPGCAEEALDEAAAGQHVWPAAARQGMQPQADACALVEHMQGSAAFHTRCCRYIENHDEPRAATVFALPVPAGDKCGQGGSNDSEWRDSATATLKAEQARHFAAAVLLMFSPGARLLHDGQLSGRRQHHSMHVAARPSERSAPWAQIAGCDDTQLAEVQWPHHAIAAFYSKLLQLATGSTASNGLWAPLPVLQKQDGEDSTSSSAALVALARVPCCTGASTLAEASMVVVVNMTHQPAGGAVALDQAGHVADSKSEEAVVGAALRSLQGAPRGVVTFSDMWSGETYRRSARLFSDGGSGLPVHLPAWGYHIFSVTAPAHGLAAAVSCAVVQDGGAAGKGVLLPVAQPKPPAVAWRI